MNKNIFNFKDRTAVITGGAQGFGLDIAKRFLESGARVIIWDIDPKMIEKAEKDLNNSNLSSNIVDVSNYKQVENSTQDILKKNNIDILINNAGITGPTASLWEYDLEMWKKVVEINIMGTFNCCRTIVPNMIKNNYGRIVNVASVDGGCVNFNFEEDVERAKLLRWYGINREENRKDFRCESDIENVGFKFHMNDVNAFIGRMNFEPVIKNVLPNHILNGNFYSKELKQVEGLELMEYSPDFKVPFWIYTIKVQNRDAFMEHMKDKNIIVSRVHERNDKHTAVKKFKADLPLLESFIDEMVCIPVGWWVGEDERNYIVESIKEGW